MYGCESWTIQKAECWRIDAFKLQFWRRLLRVPWIAGRSNQSTLKEINLEYSLKGLMLKVKLQYFGHLMWRTNSLEKKPEAGKDWGQKRREGHRMRRLDSITDSVDGILSKLWKTAEGRRACGLKNLDWTVTAANFWQFAKETSETIFCLVDLFVSFEGKL